MIPKKIFQSHKSLNYVVNDKLLSSCTNSWKKHYKTYQYNFYDDGKCDTFMKKYFAGETYDVYKKMPIPVMKSDLWRYCIIYHYGGIYADVDCKINVTPDIFINPTSEISLSVEESTNFFAQFTFAAISESPLLKSVIDHVCENMKKYNRGEMKDLDKEWIVHHLTGPLAFKRGIEIYLNKNNFKTFNKNINYENYYDKRIYFFPTFKFHNELTTHFCKGFYNGWRSERDLIM